MKRTAQKTISFKRTSLLLKLLSLVFFIFVSMSVIACEAENSNSGKANKSTPLAVSGTFVESCVSDLKQDGDLYFLGYGEPYNFVGFYKEIENTDSSDSYRIDVWVEDMGVGTPRSPGTYAIPGPGTNFWGNSIQVSVVTNSKTFVPVADTGTIILTDYDLTKPVGSLFSGSLQVQLEQVIIDETDGSTEPVPDGCKGVLNLSWYGTVIEDTK